MNVRKGETTIRLGLFALGLLALVALSVAACSRGVARPEITSTSEPPPVSRTVTDDLNRRIEIKGTPRRIVALSPTTVEILFTIGVTPVGRTTGSIYPEMAKQVPDIGAARNANIERISDLQPDLILGNVAIHENQLAKLDTLGVPVILCNFAVYSDTLKCMRLSGQVTDRDAEAGRAAKHIEDRIAAMKAKVPAKKPSFVILLGSGQSLFGALPTSYVGSLAKELGAINVAAGPEDRRFSGFTAYDMDKLAEKDPDVIIAIRPTTSVQRAPSALPTLERDPRWQNLKAVKQQGVHEVSPLLFVQNPGLQVRNAFNELGSLLYPETFGSGK